MRVVLLCATRRGRRVAEALLDLVEPADVTLVSFREEAWEPPYIDGLRALAETRHAGFVEARRMDAPEAAGLWKQPVDLLLAVSWRYLVPRAVYEHARAAFVIHDSLLPASRGFSPTVWAIANGDDHTGATLFEISEEVDAGDIVDQVRVPIADDETVTTVIERVTDSYVDLLERNLSRLLDGTAPRRPQDHAAATFCARRTPEDNRLCWDLPTRRVYDLVRAVTRPYPGAFTTLDGRRLRVWAAVPEDGAGRWVGRAPGRVVGVRPGEGSVVLTGDSGLLVQEVQLEGEQPRCAADVLNTVGQTLGADPTTW